MSKRCQDMYCFMETLRMCRCHAHQAQSMRDSPGHVHGMSASMSWLLFKLLCYTQCKRL